jgi:hypothetical protein
MTGNVVVLAIAVSVVAVACSKSSTPSATQSSPHAAATTPAPATPAIPTATTIQVPVTYGYYDGHVDTMLSTDVSNKSQAAADHINYSAALLNRPANTFPALYTVRGTAAPNQPLVFGSEPGKTDYSPIWQEIDVRWTSGVTPVLLVKDDQIKELVSKGQLTMTATPVVLNCPIVKVS